jgi:hypothetical protein
MIAIQPDLAARISGKGQQYVAGAGPAREKCRCKTDSEPETIQNVITFITKHD